MTDLIRRLTEAGAIGLQMTLGHEAAGEIARLRAIKAELIAALEVAQVELSGAYSAEWAYQPVTRGLRARMVYERNAQILAKAKEPNP